MTQRKRSKVNQLVDEYIKAENYKRTSWREKGNLIEIYTFKTFASDLSFSWRTLRAGFCDPTRFSARAKEAIAKKLGVNVEEAFPDDKEHFYYSEKSAYSLFSNASNEMATEMNKNKPTVVILGATGLVGKTLVSILIERSFPMTDLRLCSSPGGQAKEFTEADKTYKVKPFERSVFDGADIVFFSGPDDMSPEYAPDAISAGAVVIDNSAHFRMKPDVPLIIPEVNPYRIKDHQGLIANPNCTTAGLVCALAPIDKKFELEWIAASSYQAISGAGVKASESFIAETKRVVEDNFKNINPMDFPFNLIPAVGSFNGVQNFNEEDRLIEETRKILERPNLVIYPTCVRVPVLNSHSISTTFRTEKPFRPGEIEMLLADMPGVEVIDDPLNRKFPTPVMADGRDPVLVGRIRRFDDRTGGMWVVSDNLRKGAALNAVQIAELLLQNQRGES